MARIIVGIVAGMVLSGLILMGIQAALPIRAQTTGEDGVSDNFSLVNLLPDIEKIYQEALTYPFQEAKKKIYDEDIARFYQHLLEKSSLEPPDAQ